MALRKTDRLLKLIEFLFNSCGSQYHAFCAYVLCLGQTSCARVFEVLVFVAVIFTVIILDSAGTPFMDNYAGNL